MFFSTIYPRDIESLQKEKRAIVVDIRERELYQKEHWHSAICIPYPDTEDWDPALPKNKPLILYCEHGGNSMIAGRTLGKKGYEVYAVIGGYEALKKMQKNYFKN